jgi:hypothetical protein
MSNTDAPTAMKKTKHRLVCKIVFQSFLRKKNDTNNGENKKIICSDGKQVAKFCESFAINVTYSHELKPLTTGSGEGAKILPGEGAQI